MEEFDEYICSGCKNCIDPDVCWCGEDLDRGYHEDHIGIPNGCRCFYEQVD